MRAARPRSLEITVSQALNVCIAQTHDEAYADMRTFLGDRGLDIETMDEATRNQIMALVVWGDPDEVGERLADVLSRGVDGITCSLPANGHVPGRVELLGRVGTAALQRLSSLTGRQVCDHAAMEFGLFIGGWVPDYLDGRNDALEHERLVNETRIAEAGDRSNWKYVWVTEHHFLAEYSHISANEVVMPVLARTERIRVASGIINVTPPVNHPARIAERVAMLDHLSGGRFEFGTGRGSSTTEQAGFGIPDPDSPRRCSTR